MNDNPTLKFSIIIPAYNRANYVRKAVLSCLNQGYERETLEIIVVKNFLDTDLEEWLKQRSVLYINSGHIGLVDKLIEGISISNGDIICLLEDDDEFVPNKLNTLNKCFKEFTNVACIHNNFEYIEEKGYTIGKVYLKHRKNFMQAIFLKDEKQKLSFIKHKDIYHNLSCWSFRRNYGILMLKDMMGLIYNIDFLLYIEVIEQNIEMLILPEKLTIYRRHDSATMLEGNFKKIINFFESSIYSLEIIKSKVFTDKLRNFIISNIDIEQFKINIIVRRSIQISDIKKSFKTALYPTYVKKELYPFLFLYLALALFRQMRKDLYFSHAYILG